MNSYHKGYAASDSVEAEILRSLPKGVVVEKFYLDAKRLDTKRSDSIVQAALQEIHQFRPDIIIASDDDAVKRIIVPYFKDSAMPIVFCGVNWSANEYGLPCKNITGMVEVLPLEQAIETVKQFYPSVRRLVVLSENSLSEFKNRTLLDTLYKRFGLMPDYFLVNDFSDWKAAFIKANEEADLIYLPTNGAIKNWKNPEAKAFVYSHIKKPIFTCDDFMIDYAVFGFTKVAGEQGEWAAITAEKILSGDEPGQIAVDTNKLKVTWFNERLANRINLKAGNKIRSEFDIIIE